MQIEHWPVPTASAGWISADGRSDRVGPSSQPFKLASITKALVGIAALVAIEEGSISLEDRNQVDGQSAPFTVRHLLAHAAGIGPEAGDPVIEPGTRRVYSNAGFELLGAHIERSTEMTIAEYLRLAVVEPLGLQATTLTGSPAHGAFSSVDDLLLVIAELMNPTLIHPSTLALATAPQFPGLAGILPGFGNQSENSWGLGFELKGTKSPHWTSTRNSPGTFGHFGAAGTMFWVDPVSRLGCVALTDRAFGSWAASAWPILSDEVLDAG